MTVEKLISGPVASIVEALDCSPSFQVSCLRKMLGALPITENWVNAMTEPKQEGDNYHRILLHTAENYEIVLAVWPVGTATLIHNHGSSNSFGMVRVLKGKLFNHVYQEGGSGLEPTTHHYCTPGALIDVPLNLIHQMGNASDEEYAASLHVYSPAIMEVSYWDPKTLERCG